jgi:hypothetical protein
MAGVILLRGTDATCQRRPAQSTIAQRGYFAMALEKKVDKDDLLSRLRIKETLLG